MGLTSTRKAIHMSRTFETPSLVEVGSVNAVVLMKGLTPDFDDSIGSQPSTTSVSMLDVD